MAEVLMTVNTSLRKQIEDELMLTHYYARSPYLHTFVLRIATTTTRMNGEDGAS